MTLNKISLQDFIQVLSYDVVGNNACIEVEFSIDDDPEYSSCWLGKTIDRETKKECYWYGLVPDGSQAYDYFLMDEFLNAKVFRGKSIQEVWHAVTFYSIDGLDVGERLLHYLGLEPGFIRGHATPLS